MRTLAVLAVLLVAGCWEMVPADKCNMAHLSSDADKDALATAWVDCLRKYPPDGNRMASACVELKLGCSPGAIQKRLDAEDAAVNAHKEIGERK